MELSLTRNGKLSEEKIFEHISPDTKVADLGVGASRDTGKRKLDLLKVILSEVY